jgi:hypothetical protein
MFDNLLGLTPLSILEEGLLNGVVDLALTTSCAPEKKDALSVCQ